MNQATRFANALNHTIAQLAAEHPTCGYRRLAAMLHRQVQIRESQARPTADPQIELSRQMPAAALPHNKQQPQLQVLSQPH